MPKYKGQRYELRVLAGPNYDHLTHIKVNADAEPFEIHTDMLDALIVVRIRNFTGLQPNNKEITLTNSNYFDSNNDQYSIQARMRFKKDIDPTNFMIMNAFDSPIKYMPPGAGLAVKTVSWIDPGLESDIYAQKPYIRSPLLVSMNVVNVQQSLESSISNPLSWPSSNGERINEDASALIWTDEKSRAIRGNSKARRNLLANKINLSRCKITKGTIIDSDFFNPYIDFNRCAIKLPGFSIPVLRFWDGQSSLDYIAATRPRVDGDMSTADIFWIVRFELVNMEESEGSDLNDTDDFSKSNTNPVGSHYQPSDAEKNITRAVPHMQAA